MLLIYKEQLMVMSQRIRCRSIIFSLRIIVISYRHSVYVVLGWRPGLTQDYTRLAWSFLPSSLRPSWDGTFTTMLTDFKLQPQQFFLHSLSSSETSDMCHHSWLEELFVSGVPMPACTADRQEASNSVEWVAMNVILPCEFRHHSTCSNTALVVGQWMLLLV